MKNQRTLHRAVMPIKYTLLMPHGGALYFWSRIRYRIAYKALYGRKP